MLRIGIDIQYTAYPFTGIGKHTIRWVTHLANIDTYNNYYLFGVDKKKLPPELNKILIEKRNFKFIEIKIIAVKLFQGKIGAIIRDQFLLPLSALLNKVQLMFYPYYICSVIMLPCSVVTITDLEILVNARTYSFSRRSYSNFLLKLAARWAKGLVAISEATKQDAVHYLAIPAERIHLVHPGVDKHFFPVSKEEAKAWCRSRYGLDFEFVLYTGGLGRRKNLPRMARAFEKVRARLSKNIKIVMTRHVDPENTIFKILRSDYELEIVFLGIVPEDELRYLYSAAELVLYPSLFEGFGMPISEAQACGAPVITSNVTSMPEIAGDAGLLVDPTKEEEISEAIIRVLSDQSLRYQMSVKGIENSKRFSWMKGAHQLLEIFNYYGNH